MVVSLSISLPNTGCKSGEGWLLNDMQARREEIQDTRSLTEFWAIGPQADLKYCTSDKVMNGLFFVGSLHAESSEHCGSR